MYTGLKDKNGNKIFSGDTLHFDFLNSELAGNDITLVVGWSWKKFSWYLGETLLDPRTMKVSFEYVQFLSKGISQMGEKV